MLITETKDDDGGQIYVDPKGDVEGLQRMRRFYLKTAPYREWQERLKSGDRLPRGKFFKGKKPVPRQTIYGHMQVK